MDKNQKDALLSSLPNNMLWLLCAYIYVYLFGVSKPPIQNPCYTQSPQFPLWIWPQTPNARDVTVLPVHKMGTSTSCYYFNKLTNHSFLFIYANISKFSPSATSFYSERSGRKMLQ